MNIIGESVRVSLDRAAIYLNMCCGAMLYPHTGPGLAVKVPDYVYEVVKHRASRDRT
jgi:hypothetical protein